MTFEQDQISKMIVDLNALSALFLYEITVQMSLAYRECR